ncbi:acetamidase/formamidase family protein, partial [Micromonospora harpali]
NLVSYRPKPEDLAYTFGGRPAVAGIQPGTIVEMYTEDCFAGRVTSVDDLPSRVCDFPYLNPVTGPFHVEGAEPGDTLALHLVSVEPARDWAVSTTFPHFGALTGTHTTAMLTPPLDEVVWLYDVDVAAGVVRYHARRSDFTAELPLDRMHGTVGVAPGASEARMTITPDAHGGNMDSPELRAGVTVYLG